MKSAFVFIATIWTFLISWQCHSQIQGEKEEEHAVDRKPVVAGQFYPSNKAKLTAKLEEHFKHAEKKQTTGRVLALIAPHAGYSYSGQVAASAYNQLDPDCNYDNIFIIAPSHRVAFNGASVYDKGDYITPLGKVKVNSELASKLIKDHEVFVFKSAAHQNEHSLEVQLPFLQHYLHKDFRIIPIVTGTHNQQTIKKIAEILGRYFNQNNLFVVSTDFSHYPDYQDAKRVDHATAHAISKNDPAGFSQVLHAHARDQTPNLATSLCGWPGVLTLLHITANKAPIHVNRIHYQNSGDVTNRKDRVVGYWAISFTKGQNKTQHTMDFRFAEEEKKELLKIARQTLEEYICNDQVPDFDSHQISDGLKRETGAFVTLKSGGVLRGCIGRFEANTPVYRLIVQMAIASATQDMRFPPVTEEELDDITIEISILTPMKKVDSIDEIELGTHGVYIRQGNSAGTLLPQVPIKFGWTKAEFLGHCARDKAGIGWEGWKEAEVYSYKAIVFNEKDYSA